MQKKTRRDFLFVLSSVAGAVGVTALTWPFIKQLRPDAQTQAAGTVDIDLSKIEEGMSITVKWRGQPVVIRNRTAKEVAAAKDVDLHLLKDPKARNPNVPESSMATDLLRSAGPGKENWLIVINRCTHLGCIPLDKQGPYGGWFCPCHGSVYDTAGRVRSGPANRNLAIPPYRFITDTLLRLG